MSELPFRKQACLNYCFRAYLANLSPGTRQARAGTPEVPFRHSKITPLVRNYQTQG